MSWQKIWIFFFGAVSFLLVFHVVFAQEQTPRERWSEPYRLSSEAGKASEGYCVADGYGYVHCLWTEILFEDSRTIIQYARFDGETWSGPNDVYVTGAAIGNVSPVVDQQGILHIVWVEGLSGPAFYTHAPANDALSARSWAPPLQIDIPANTLHLQVDSKGVLHILYINRTDAPGIYHVASEDQGKTWSEITWLDPDILSNHIPDSLSFQIDENDGLHAAWFYGGLDQDTRPDWVRYTHSFDGGATWSVPFLIDHYVEAREHNLTVASPVMIVSGKSVHVIWAAGSLPYRYHRFSTDAGETWSPSRQIFGELHGQAFDGLAVDDGGRVHFFGQIRYPIGIYHSYWNENQWTSPSLIYLIANEGDQGFGDRIHAHHTFPVVRAGNQLVFTFGDGPAEPGRRLFAMQLTLDDIAPQMLLPTPAPTITTATVARIDSQPKPTSTPTVKVFDITSEPLEAATAPSLALQAAMLPTLLLLVIVVLTRLLYKLKS